MMTVIRDDDNERLVRIEHMIETIKRRQEDIAAVVHESAEAVEEAAKTPDGRRSTGQRWKDTDET